MEGDTYITPNTFCVTLDGKYADIQENGTVKVIIDGKDRFITDLRDFEIAVPELYTDEPLINIVNRGLSRIEGTRGIKRIRIR